MTAVEIESLDVSCNRYIAAEWDNDGWKGWMNGGPAPNLATVAASVEPNQLRCEVNG